MSKSTENTPLVAFCNWVTRLVWINILFILFTCLGLLIFGLSPALSTSIKMLNEYLNGAHKISLAKFYREWKKSWATTNLIGVPLLISIYSLWWYCEYLINIDNAIWNIIGLSLIPLALLILQFYICACTLYAQAHCSLKELINKSIKLLVTKPSIPFAFMVSVLVCTGIYYLMPILGIMFSISPSLLIIVYLYNENIDPNGPC